MLDAVTFEEVWKKVSRLDIQGKTLLSFVRFLEKRSGARVVYDIDRVPFHRPELVDLLLIAGRLKERGAVHAYHPLFSYWDEPPLFQWSAVCTRPVKALEDIVANGISLSSERDALAATLAEAVERHVWAARASHLSLRAGSVSDVSRRGRIVPPERFAGFTEEQRQDVHRLSLAAEKNYNWTRGYSWAAACPIWIPVQTVSGNPDARLPDEPIIKEVNTTGVAAFPTREGALLRAALEIIERDAYMIMWLNQLSLPQFDLEVLRASDAVLDSALARCERYNLRPIAVRLITDAPAYAVCVVLEDLSAGALPRMTVGLKAHREPARAIEGALAEAMRARHTARSMKQRKKDWDPAMRASKVVHMDRLLYWMEGDRAEKLRFLVNGQVQIMPREPWEDDTEGGHFDRIVAWCRSNEYECASVSLTKSDGNATPWHIEAVVIPELQPMHVSERLPQVGGARLQSIPERFGMPPRNTAYLDDPHPFA